MKSIEKQYDAEDKKVATDDDKEGIKEVNEDDEEDKEETKEELKEEEDK